MEEFLSNPLGRRDGITLHKRWKIESQRILETLRNNSDWNRLNKKNYSEWK